jgi:hypothetical protein
MLATVRLADESRHRFAIVSALSHVEKEYSMTDVDLKNTKPKAKRDLVVIPEGETLRSPSDKFFQGCHLAALSDLPWDSGDLDYQYYQDEHSGFRYALGSRDKDGKFIPLSEEKFKTQAAKFGAESSLVYRIITTLWTEAYFNGTLEPGEAITIHMNQLLELEGETKNRNGSFNTKRKDALLEKVWFMARFDAQGVRKLPRGKTQRITGSLLDILTTEEETYGVPTGYSITVRPGLAARPFFIDDGNRLIGYFFMALAKLAINRPGAEKDAFLIGTYVSAIFRNREKDASYSNPIHVETILQGSKVEVESNSSLFGRFRTKFEKALDKLSEIGVIAGWEYVAENFDRIPEYKWFPAWLKCGVLLRPPQTVLDSGKIRKEQYEAHISEAKRVAGSRQKRKVKAIEAKSN